MGTPLPTSKGQTDGYHVGREGVRVHPRFMPVSILNALHPSVATSSPFRASRQRPRSELHDGRGPRFHTVRTRRLEIWHTTNQKRDPVLSSGAGWYHTLLRKQKRGAPHTKERFGIRSGQQSPVLPLPHPPQEGGGVDGILAKMKIYEGDQPRRVSASARSPPSHPRIPT